MTLLPRDKTSYDKVYSEITFGHLYQFIFQILLKIYLLQVVPILLHFANPSFYYLIFLINKQKILNYLRKWIEAIVYVIKKPFLFHSKFTAIL